MEDDEVVKKVRYAERYCDKHDMSFTVWNEKHVFKKQIRKPAILQ